MKITVLMSTYNGEKYLREQINSILNQTDVLTSIFVRDDGSTDGTTEILEEYKKQGILTWYTGPNLRPAKSFMDLLKNAPDSEYYAFCDQDDVWMPEKLCVAIEKIKDIKGSALYCSDTLLVDSSLKTIRQGGLHADGTFVESLITNPCTGCTMVFNKALHDIALLYIPDYISMHDWWLYRICMAVGGYFFFDTTPYIKYRQHENNVIGGQSSKLHKLKTHVDYFIHPKEGVRFIMAKELYKGYYDLMSDKNKSILDMFVSYKYSIANTWRLVSAPEIKIKNKKILDTFRRAVLLRKY